MLAAVYVEKILAGDVNVNIKQNTNISIINQQDHCFKIFLIQFPSWSSLNY